jgi:hypothetical protein
LRIRGAPIDSVLRFKGLKSSEHKKNIVVAGAVENRKTGPFSSWAMGSVRGIAGEHAGGRWAGVGFSAVSRGRGKVERWSP